MRRPRRLFAGILGPDFSMPFVLLPDGDGHGGDGGPPTAPPTAPPAPSPAPPPAPTAPPETGFPADKPVNEMTAEQQAAYWRHRSRQNEDEKKALAKWKAENDGKLGEYDRLVEASKTENERAIEAARAESAKTAREQARGELVRPLVDAEFRAAAKGALTREQVADILAPLDPTHFLDSNGDVDTAKVTAYVEKVAPAANGGQGGNGAGKWPGTNGQGSRPGAGTGKGVDAGRELYERMNPRPQNAAAS